MTTYVIIVAGGNGSRMMVSTPKQFLPVQGKTILQHTLEAFHKVDPTFKYIVVLPEDQIDWWKSHCVIKKFNLTHQVVAGGSERFHSVKNALANITDKGLVLIHDGVRPCVSKQTIKNVIETAIKFGNAVPCLPVVESLREMENGKNVARDRSRFVTVQTPQAFLSNDIKKAYEQNYDASFTDDATVVERLGMTIHLTEGNRENIKVTTQEDLKWITTNF